MRQFFAIIVVLVAVVATPAMARGRVVVVRSRPMTVSHRPVYIHRPVMVHRPVRIYRPVHVMPQPVFCASRPVVYVQPPVVMQAEPMMVEAPPVIVQQLHIPEGFVETGRDLHSHGSDAGLVDEVHGILNGKKVTIEYNDDGTIKEIEDD